jgi:hypothetical protein
MEMVQLYKQSLKAVAWIFVAIAAFSAGWHVYLSPNFHNSKPYVEVQSSDHQYQLKFYTITDMDLMKIFIPEPVYVSVYDKAGIELDKSQIVSMPDLSEILWPSTDTENPTQIWVDDDIVLKVKWF